MIILTQNRLQPLKVLTWNLNIPELNEGISFSRSWFSGSMLNVQDFYVCVHNRIGPALPVAQGKTWGWTQEGVEQSNSCTSGKSLNFCEVVRWAEKAGYDIPDTEIYIYMYIYFIHRIYMNVHIYTYVYYDIDIYYRCSQVGGTNGLHLLNMQCFEKKNIQPTLKNKCK